MTKRVTVTRPFFNIATMQVCAVSDVTDEEILSVCNRENPSGTERGWVTVLRTPDEDNPFKNDNKMPVSCADDPERIHLFVLC